MYRDGAGADSGSLGGADRVLATLKVLGDYSSGVSLDELARRLGSPKSSLHRALSQLRRAGFADQDASGRYRLGHEFLRLAFAYYERRDESQVVRPLLGALAERFGETAHFARLEGAEIVYLGKVSPAKHFVQMTSSIGGRNPAHATALGKALLAYTLPDDAAVEAFVSAYGPLTRRTQNTLVTAEQLSRELARIRKHGYSVDVEESETGINCMAFPLFMGSPTEVTAAVSISALAPRTPVSKLVEAEPEIRAIIESHLGNVLPATRSAGSR